MHDVGALVVHGWGIVEMSRYLGVSEQKVVTALADAATRLGTRERSR